MTGTIDSPAADRPDVAASAAGATGSDAAPVIDPAVAIQLRMALSCIVIAVCGGAAAALHYIPDASLLLNGFGLGLAQLRPVHTSFASLWIFGASVAVIYHWLSTTHGGLQPADRTRFRFHTACWLTAGAGIFFTLLAGISTGREYLGFHPVFSAILLAGWLAFAFTFLKRLRHGFWAQPVYLWFWTTGILYFVYTFVEGHSYLLPSVFEQPVRDLQVQWKSCGTLVGSFNFLMYGSLTYVGERLSGDRRYAQSPTAFWLFGVGCLNSFTNYVHHTYHLPQNEIVKWVAFIVSMMEVIILFKLVIDIGRMVRNGEPKAFCGRGGWLVHAKWWTCGMLAVSILISVPNWNSIVHGTQVIVGHAMGTTIGIDTMVLLGCASWLVCELRGPAGLRAMNAPTTKFVLRGISLALAVLVTWLTAAGTSHGWHRFVGEATPEWVVRSRFVLPVFGSVLGACLLYVTMRLLGLLKQGRDAARDA
ncbi:MAG: cbb3-type cytochrome c oxidase subunit I [Planctomycetes bacterium]|nr:cbb3-type cytochrome c oxidase subunit I [Planctomycetota bacterium]